MFQEKYERGGKGLKKRGVKLELRGATLLTNRNEDETRFEIGVEIEDFYRSEYSYYHARLKHQYDINIF